MDFWVDRGLNSWFVGGNRGLFWVTDCLVGVAIVFNLLVLVLTNALVVVESPVVGGGLVEANLVYGELVGFVEDNVVSGGVVLDGYVYSGDYSVLFGVLLRLLAYFGVLLAYFYLRGNVFSYRGWFGLFAVALLVCLVWGYDFFNDFGFWIGTVLRGGT